ncbi:MAG: hypothetical protein IKX66_00860 [Clostridia bacterium]|nr:hypothetical protein [Clostridia bacterium]
MKGDRAGRFLFVAFFIALLILAAVAVGFAVRFAYVRYTGDFGSGSLAGLSSLPVPILCLILGAPLLAFLFAVLVTSRAIRRAKTKDEAEREHDPEREDGDSDFL